MNWIHTRFNVVNMADLLSEPHRCSRYLYCFWLKLLLLLTWSLGVVMMSYPHSGPDSYWWLRIYASAQMMPHGPLRLTLVGKRPLCSSIDPELSLSSTISFLSWKELSQVKPLVWLSEAQESNTENNQSLTHRSFFFFKFSYWEEMNQIRKIKDALLVP